MATAAVPEMDIVLFNVSGVRDTRTIEEDFKTMVGGYNDPLFVLTTGLSNQQKNYLCKRLQKHSCKRDDQTAVYCHMSDPEEFKTSHIDLDTLNTVKVELGIKDKYFTMTRLKACVLTPTEPGYGKILLVSWQGQKNYEHLGAEGMTDIDKETTFVKLVHFLDGLKKKEGCEVAIVGGDFNMPSHKTGNFLKTLKPEGDMKPAIAARPDEPSRPLIIYWPQSKLQFEEKNSNTLRYAFELQPKTAQNNNGDSSHGSHPKLGIGLLNVYDGNNEKPRQNAIRYVLRRINDNYQKPLFVLCQDGIKPPKHSILCEKLRCDYKACGMRKEEAGVYYRPSQQYEVTYVEDSTLEDEKKDMGIEITDFKVSRLMVCVVTPTVDRYGQVLLVSWHGPRGITNDKKKVLFKTVVEFLGHLMLRKKCKTVVLGGDFNMPFGKALECLKDLEKRAKEVTPKEQENKEQENKEESKEQRARDEENKDDEDKEHITTEQEKNKEDDKEQEKKQNEEQENRGQENKDQKIEVENTEQMKERKIREESKEQRNRKEENKDEEDKEHITTEQENNKEDDKEQENEAQENRGQQQKEYEEQENKAQDKGVSHTEQIKEHKNKTLIKEQLTTEQSQEQQNKGETKQQEDEELQYYSAQAHPDQDKSKLLDYIIYWPRSNTARPLIDCPDYEKEMNFWPFDHRVFCFSFTEPGRSARRHSTQQTLISGTSKRPAKPESSNMPGHSQQKQARRDPCPSGH